ncbi:hypothetical protein ACA910_017220 [Epithemia clementina (nom. ined.)]
MAQSKSPPEKRIGKAKTTSASNGTGHKPITSYFTPSPGLKAASQRHIQVSISDPTPSRTAVASVPAQSVSDPDVPAKDMQKPPALTSTHQDEASKSSVLPARSEPAPTTDGDGWKVVTKPRSCPPSPPSSSPGTGSSNAPAPSTPHRGQNRRRGNDSTSPSSRSSSGRSTGWGGRTNAHTGRGGRGLPRISPSCSQRKHLPTPSISTHQKTNRSKVTQSASTFVPLVNPYSTNKGSNTRLSFTGAPSPSREQRAQNAQAITHFLKTQAPASTVEVSHHISNTTVSVLGQPDHSLLPRSSTIPSAPPMPEVPNATTMLPTPPTVAPPLQDTPSTDTPLPSSSMHSQLTVESAQQHVARMATALPITTTPMQEDLDGCLGDGCLGEKRAAPDSGTSSYDTSSSSNSSPTHKDSSAAPSTSSDQSSSSMTSMQSQIPPASDMLLEWAASGPEEDMLFSDDNNAMLTQDTHSTDHRTGQVETTSTSTTPSSVLPPSRPIPQLPTGRPTVASRDHTAVTVEATTPPGGRPNGLRGARGSRLPPDSLANPNSGKRLRKRLKNVGPKRSQDSPGMADDDTIHQGNPLPPDSASSCVRCPQTGRRFAARWDVKLNLPPSTDPVTDLVRICKEIFQQLRTVDPEAVIYPWETDWAFGSSPLPPLLDPDSIPTILPNFKRYFPRVWPTYDGATMYTSIWAGTLCSMETVVGSIKHWMDREGHAILPQKLQCQETATVGWLVYSDNEIDCSELAKDIHLWINYEVECRWRVILIGKRGKLDKDERVQAIHLLVSSEDRDDAEDALRELYSSTATQFPLGITMRLVPELGTFTDPNTSAKC